LLATFLVSNTADSGLGSLRQAIMNANSTAGANRIEFNISGAGVHTIQPGSALPALTGTVAIDGTTEPGYAGSPLIVLNGSAAGATANGLTLRGSGSAVKGLVINGFAQAGLLLTVGGNDTITANYIGTAAAGTNAVGNGEGIRLDASSNNRIGDGTAAGRNLISGNRGSCVDVLSQGNQIQGNYIGTDVTGTQRLANTGDGVHIQSGSGNTIGGTTPAARNLISGNNGNGIYIASDHNQVQGNYIGTDVTGTHRLSNGFPGFGRFNGVEIDDAPDNVVGGTAPGAGNLISANTNDGILIQSSFANPRASNNLVEGNTIGTDVTGSVALGNQFNGVEIVNGSNNAIGGTDHGAGNLISGNGASGVQITGFGPDLASGNLVQGNLIGTDATSTARLGNAGIGVNIARGFQNTVGGTSADARNIISGNGLGGVEIFGVATGNRILGNYIGTDRSGTRAVGNGFGLDLFGASNNFIGGTDPGAGNLISGNAGNGGDGLHIDGASGNYIQGNFIGTDVSGSVALANEGAGIDLFDNASGNLIGGTSVAARNVISGNHLDGVLFLFGAARQNQVQGNYIGTDVTGTFAVPNGLNGVCIGGGGNNILIGGTDAGAGNLISGNLQAGIAITGASTSGNTVQGNYIGTDASRTHALGNQAGVQIDAQAGANTIGGTAVGAGNLISGNRSVGILLQGNGTVVQGNTIGTDVTGATALANPTGVMITGSNNVIGGTAPGAGNVISGNRFDGVEVDGGTGNVVAGDFIGTDATGTRAVGNGHFGVSLNGAGNTNNLVGGTAAGARNVISANIFGGVSLSAGAHGNKVQGNFIGTDVSGTRALGNPSFGFGVSFANANDNLIGGPGAGNVLSASNIGILMNASTGNQIQGNYIGTNATGTVALGNCFGLYLGAGANNNFIGGSAPGTGNIISSNIDNGLEIFMGASGNTVQGNFIGTDATGSRGLGNGGVGIQIAQNSNNNTVGGTASGAGNVISGNVSYGLDVFASTGTVIQGNYIGTNATGTLAIANSIGVTISGSNNLIGGPAAGARNVISGNLGDGIYIQGPSTTGIVVQGNRIGTDGTGTLALGNGRNGVTVIGGAHDNTIGGTAAGAGNVISGNVGDGIDVFASTGTVIQGNYIGTDATGTLAIANSTGVTISGSNNLIGGPAAGARNVISGNLGDGVTIFGGSGNTIQGNYIGTDAAGTHALGNTRGLFIRASGNTFVGNVISGSRGNGLELDLPAGNNNVVQGNKIGTDASGLAALANNGVGIAIQTSGNLIGGTAAGQGNLISGNSAYGVEIFAGSSNTSNTIQGNFIGTNVMGTSAVPNQIGIFVAAGANTIGGTASGAGNVISGNSDSGIFLGSSGNLVQGNLIGLDATGTHALANTNGLTVSSANNTIGGTAVGARNVISGNQNAGIRVFGGGVIQGNYIGTDASGTAAVGNAIGVSVSASNTTIGGTAAGAGNVIAGNVSYGLYVQSGSGNLVEGNYFGTDATGTAALGNSYDIRIDSSNNTVGGTAAGARNLIAGSFTGVYVFSGTGNLIQGNYIGTDVTGTQALGNTFGVLLFTSQSQTIVGGTAPGAGNLISGNTSDGLQIFSGGNVVQGNTIGTDVSGTVALGNGGDGVIVTNGSNNLIGGTAAGAGNLISGNGGDGIGLAASTGSGTGNVIQGNRIGTDATGTVALGNGRGIYLNNMTGTTVGGTAAAAGNLISGNAGDGIFFFAGGNNLVQGNRIGTDVTGTLALGNGGNGVDLSAGAHDITIGGAAPGAGNVIAFNGHDGVLIDGGDRNLVSRNSIFANAHLGVELLDHGNNDQAAPELTSARVHRRPGAGGGDTTIKGTFTGQPATTYTLEFYADSGTPAQGRQFLGSITVTLDKHGSARFSLSIGMELSPGEFVTATATDPNNNTSSFSAGVAVVGA
jgi:hypothetical protein